MIETSQLQTLLAVSKAKSFSKAAEDLRVTQSAISQSIKNLEKKLDVKIFRRSGKRVILTPEGEKLYSLANDFLSQIEDTLEEIKHDKESMSGKVRIGTLTGIGKSWLAPELLDFSDVHPELTVSLQLGFQEDIVKKFNNYRLDILILPEDCIPQSGEKLLLSEERSTLVFPNNSEFKIHKDTTLEELSKFPTILFEQGDPLYFNWCRKRFGKNPKKINTRFVVNSHRSMLQAVQKGLGVAVVPNHVLGRSFYRDKVATLGKGYDVSNGKFYIIYHKESSDMMRIKKTIERLVSVSNPLAMVL